MKILVLFCGGTIVMTQNKEKARIPQNKETAIKQIYQLEPRISEIAEINMEYITNVDSTNITTNNWDEIIQIIGKNYQKYDGFVITHGTDTMAYTASALSFAIQNLGKPIVLTGSQIEGNKLATDARKNFINAVRITCKNIAGVFIVFNNRILKGVRSSKISESSLDAYTSINASDIGKINIDIEIDFSVPKRHKKKIKTNLGFESNILVMTIIPFNNKNNFDYLISILKNKQIKGLILRGYGPGNIPYNFSKIFDIANKNKIPVIVMSQCLQGITKMKYYDVGIQALKKGVIESYDMSLEAVTTKLMWALKHYSYQDISYIMKKNIIGEIMVD